MIFRAIFICLTMAALSLTCTSSKADVPPEFWTQLAARSEGPVVISIKYADAAARNRVMQMSIGGADLPFISRVVARIDRDIALTLEADAGIKDMEVFGASTADRTFHKLVELYRVYLYQVSGRFNISAVNFSQGIRYFDINSKERGDRSIREAIEVIASRIAPVLVAVGDGREFGVGAWAMAPSALPVVATSEDGRDVLENSARPERGGAPWKTVLYADGAPRSGETRASGNEACGDGAHLTADQMLNPETAMVPEPGGSSFATFKATASVCYIHQYAEVLRVMLRARTPVGPAEVEPFVSYYVDSPVNDACPAMNHRWADKRLQFGAPQYVIRAEDKARLDNFVHQNSIEIRLNYSIPILKSFLNQLPSEPITDAGPKEIFVSPQHILSMLRNLRLVDLVQIAANPANIHFQRWKARAQADQEPALRAGLLDAIETYCKSNSLYLVLSDEAKKFFIAMP